MDEQELFEVERRLVTLDDMVDISIRVLGQYTSMFTGISDSADSIRYSAIIQRSGLALLLGNFEEAAQLLEAFCLAMQICRPSLTMLTYSVYSGVEIAIALSSVRHVFLLSECLQATVCCLSGLKAMRDRCLDFLSRVDQDTLAELRRTNPYAATLEERMSTRSASLQQIGSLTADRRKDKIIVSPERIGFELGQTEAVIRRVLTSLQSFYSTVENEARQLLSPQPIYYDASSSSSYPQNQSFGTYS